MNYLKIYNNLTIGNQQRILPEVIYTKACHHIIPEGVGGPTIDWNLVNLTFKEHFIAHHLLTKIYKNTKPINIAFALMCNTSKDIRVTSRVYDNAMRRMADSKKGNTTLSESSRNKISKTLTGHRGWNKGKKWSEETKLKMSKANKGRIAWNKNIPRGPHTEESLSKMRKPKRAGHKIGLSNKGKIRTEEMKLRYKLSQPNYKGPRP